MDILQVGIMASLGSWHFAKHIYEYGRNSLKDRDSENDDYELVSLQQLAVAADRKRADPYYTQFIAYFNSNSYADKQIAEALSGSGKWKTDNQRRQVVVATSAYQVVFMYILAELRETITQCRDPDFDALDASMHPWDEVAALLVGSLEGTAEGGSSDLADGQLIFNLANSRAFQFQTLNDEGYALVNSDLLDLMFAGKGELDAKDCDNLEKTASRIEKALLVPLIQSALRYATTAEKQSTAEGSIEAALGEVFAFSVLPFLSAVDQDSAEVIRESMEIIEGVSPVRDGAQTVADAFGSAAEKFGIDCPDLGYLSQADPCRLLGGHSTSRANTTPPSGSRKTGIFLVFAAAIMLSVGLDFML